MTLSQIYTRSCVTPPASFDHLIDIKRETGRWLLAATDFVGATAAKRAANAICIERETELALVLKSVAFSRIKRYASRTADPLCNRFQALDTARQRATCINRAKLL